MRPRILYLLGSYPRWSETFLRQDLALLIEAGVPLQAVTLFPGDSDSPAPLPNEPAVTPLLSTERKAAASGRARVPWNVAARFLAALPRSTRATLSLLRHRALDTALARLLNESRSIVHVHAEFADLPGLLAATAARRGGRSFSLGVHARDVFTMKYAPARLFDGAAFLTACNTAARDRLQALWPAARERLHLLHHGVALDAWPFRNECLPASGTMRLLFIGRFIEKKGVPVLLRALRILHDRGVAAHLTLIGAGPQDAQWRSMARELGIAGSLSWRGIMPRPALAAELHASDGLVVPSVTARDRDADGIPNTIIEAMAAGVPVIAALTGGIPEVVSTTTGWPVGAGDAAALADTLLAFRAAPQEAETRRIQARRTVERDFDARRLARQRAQLFEDILSTHEKVSCRQ